MWNKEVYKLTDYIKEDALHKGIGLLKKQLKEANETIRKLRRELSIANRDNQYKEKKSWAELDERKKN
jgi:hypothetical protein